MNNKTQKLCQDISGWLYDYLEGKGLPPETRSLKSFIIGVSGGIDSAVVSTLCAMTSKPTIVVSIPIQSHSGNTSLAVQHCLWLQEKFPNVSVCYNDLTEVFEVAARTLPFSLDAQAINLAHANLKSRLRMAALYHHATLNRGIVVGTGNKVEDFGVGFFTKYGDGGVDVSPIGDLMKSEVRECARELGIIPEIINAIPSDGLYGPEDTTHTDEAQLGASYDELEWAMRYCEGIHTMQGLTARQREVLALYRKLNTRNQHKMVPIPKFIKK